MDDTKKQAAEIRKVLAKAKSDPIAFAFCPGVKGDDVFIVDFRKEPEQIARKARQESSGTKTAFGTLTLSGSAVTLQPEATLPKLGKQVRDHFRKLGLKLQVIYDDEDDEDADAAQADGDGSTGDQGDEAPAFDPRPVIAARKIWTRTRGAILTDTKALIAAITTATKGQAGLETVPDKAKGLVRHIAPFDNRLGQALEAVETAPDDDARAKAVEAAKRLIEDHAKLVQTDYFNDVDQNGFVKTRIRETVLTSLRQVNAALSA